MFVDLSSDLKNMAKFKRNRRAKNKIEGSLQGTLVNADPQNDATAEVRRPTTALKLVRSSLFTAELEEAIELIARERVYRAMRMRLERQLRLSAPEADDGHAR